MKKNKTEPMPASSVAHSVVTKLAPLRDALKRNDSLRAHCPLETRGTLHALNEVIDEMMDVQHNPHVTLEEV